MLLLNQVNWAKNDPLSTFYSIKTADPEKQKSKNDNDLNLGRVSMDLIFLLHPAMRDYNFAVDSFFKDIPKNLSIPVEFYIKDRHKAVQEFKGNFNQRYQQLEVELAELKQQIEIARQEYLKSNNALLTSQTPNKQANSRYESIENQYWLRRKDLETQIENVKNKFDEWVSNNSKEIFLSIEERNRRLEKIITEIKSTITQLAQSRNIQLVFNRNAQTLGTRGRLFNLPEKRFITDQYNPLKRFLNDEFFFGYEGRGASQEYLHTFNNYLNNYNNIQEVFSQSYEQFDTLGKVEDLTLPSLKSIFDQYNYPDALTAKLIDIVRTWRIL